ncbi:MAG: PhoH family protein [Candidatus Lokiarchaeota archaeon]|nr:PhoH family protein [Candidatus Lokiarchaeota archaeon]
MLNTSRFSQVRMISVYGDTGVGKTTFALQTASKMVALGKKNLIIYTKNEFPIERLFAIENNDKNRLETFLNNSLILKPLNFKELRTISFYLEPLFAYLIQEENFLPNLIILDSITDLYKLELNTEKKEKNIELNYELNQVLANLLKLSENHDLEILLVNDSSRKTVDDQITEVQGGGQVMDYWVSVSIKIARTMNLNERSFELIKSPEKIKKKFVSRLTGNGFQ